MSNVTTVDRLVNLLDPDSNLLFNKTLEEAENAVGSGDAASVRQIDGQFALLQKRGNIVRMARSIGRPMRYFLAKLVDGPCLIVAERMEEIADWLVSQGLEGQFHPAYTRMVPAHHITEIALVGCPDPNPVYTRYFAPERNTLPNDIEEIGRCYLSALQREIGRWLDGIEDSEPLGVLFSGGIDSGSVFLVLYDLLLKRGQSPARLKAFTLSVDKAGADVEQAREFLEQLDLGMFLETIEVPADEVRLDDAVAAIEDYKPLDVQSAAMALALCRGIRGRYPDWTWLIDGDGGDENLKDYPIEANPELTIRSVLNNTMLYQEGWGVDKIKHSLTYSGGQSRGHVRSYAPACRLGFRGFSPYAVPNVIEVAEGIPFIELTDWEHDRLYSLKGQIVRSGVEAVTGFSMPVFEKRRFQHGTMNDEEFAGRFPGDEAPYRAALDAHFAAVSR